MVWLWMIFPALLLGAALALWRAAERLAAERRALQAELEILPAVAASARSLRDAERGRGATGQEPVRR